MSGHERGRFLNGLADSLTPTTLGFADQYQGTSVTSEYVWLLEILQPSGVSHPVEVILRLFSPTANLRLDDLSDLIIGLKAVSVILTTTPTSVAVRRMPVTLDLLLKSEKV